MPSKKPQSDDDAEPEMEPEKPRKKPRRDATGGGRAWLKDFNTDLKKYFRTSERGKKIARAVKPFNPKTNKPTIA